MKRGEVWWVILDQSLGGEIKKKRPAVIISNDAANRYLNRLQVVPLTTQIGRIYPSETVVTFKDRQSKALADQLTTVSKQRLINQAGKLTAADMQRVERVIKMQLGLLARALQI